MSQQEDDLRALAKIMDFLRAVSIILVVMNVYWFCYEAISLWGCGHRRGGQNPDELRPHGGAVPIRPLHETVCRPPACPVLHGHERSKGGENHLAKDMGGACRRVRALFPELVDSGTAVAR